MFERELEAYHVRLPELLADEGKFVLVCGDEFAEVFDDYDRAIEAGYQKYGLVTYLVKKIELEAAPVAMPTMDGATSWPRIRLKLWHLMILGAVAPFLVWPFKMVSPSARGSLLHEFVQILIAFISVCLTLLLLALNARLLVALIRRNPVTAGLIVSCALPYIIWVDHGVRVQRDAVRALTWADATVRYDWQMGGRTNPTAGLPLWAGVFADFEYFSHLTSNVTGVSFGPLANNESLELLWPFQRLERISFQMSSNTTDAGLARLPRLRALRRLDLCGTSVSDAGLVHLKDIPTLELVDLSLTRVTKVGVNNLHDAFPSLSIR
jgi:hypothetical protein